MDANKSEKLREIGYGIGPSCGTCVYAEFHDADFGECSMHTYVHLKHSGGRRKLSVYFAGSCPQFERDPHVEIQIHGFKEFLKG